MGCEGPRPILRSTALAALAAVLAVGTAMAGEARRTPCPADAPPGVRFPDRPGCRERPAAGTAERGFFDLGGGTSVRVGGRVRGEVETRR